MRLAALTFAFAVLLMGGLSAVSTATSDAPYDGTWKGNWDYPNQCWPAFVRFEVRGTKIKGEISWESGPPKAPMEGTVESDGSFTVAGVARASGRSDQEFVRLEGTFSKDGTVSGHYRGPRRWAGGFVNCNKSIVELVRTDHPSNPAIAE